MDGFKENYENIKIPLETDMVIQKAIRDGERHIKLKFKVVSSLIAFLLCFSILGSGFVSTAMASVLSKVPIIGSVFENMDNEALNKVSVNGFTDKYNMAVTHDGITVTIKEVYYDETRLTVGYEVKGASPIVVKIRHNGLNNSENTYSKSSAESFIETNLDPFWLDCSFNGKEISNSTSGSFIKKLSEDSYYGSITYDLYDVLPNAFDLTIEAKYYNISLSDGKINSLKFIRDYSVGMYYFRVPVTMTKTAVRTREVSLMKHVRVGETELFIKKITLTPIVTKIDYEVTGPLPGDDSIILMDEENDETIRHSITTSHSANGGILCNNEYSSLEKIPERMKIQIVSSKGKIVDEIKFTTNSNN